MTRDRKDDLEGFSEARLLSLSDNDLSELEEGNIVCRASSGRFLIGVVKLNSCLGFEGEISEVESPRLPVESEPARRCMSPRRLQLVDVQEQLTSTQRGAC